MSTEIDNNTAGGSVPPQRGARLRSAISTAVAVGAGAAVWLATDGGLEAALQTSSVALMLLQQILPPSSPPSRDSGPIGPVI